ncbi:D-(-)-3-hydroxybutyrate oligomer hydrolase [Ideonella livida]|uniref:D-(-)-3-hydroxybutyrate oligomer hydrolase n=1 Tax=Ideonella livida TaxID=2707176 RepID=A0A7C9PJZ5_9BURK|nr:D-(-)-3-hydroxybutyrate oligomer hydrolase [Ideonella livida]NDY93916.1 D-(-)-3-hydroxybutyrate oligomer hydrolase [Ideonella livida]
MSYVTLPGRPRALALAVGLALSTGVLAAGGPLPAGLRGPVSITAYDGVSDDLLTAGLGKTGLMGLAPTYANPAAPTAAELRRNAIYNNYRGLVDYTAAGGMGVLYGPNIDVDGQPTLGEGKVAGTEYLAWSDDGSGRQNVTVMVQVPASFKPAEPCIVTATSSGSRGIYGAIATAGEWGLKHGCAVAYTDKGTGNGFHDLMTGTVTARDGTLLTAASAGTAALFRADVDDATLAAFNADTPHRVAYKHAHSQQNPEKDWGRHTLDAVRFAFHVLNAHHRPTGGARYRPANTLVIASSVSNGGGAAIAAAEQDTEGLIDGVAVSEPNVQVPGRLALSIRQGDRPVGATGKALVDYFTLANVYQPCAALAPAAGLSLHSLFWPAAYTTAAENRCTALAARGLVSGATTAERATSALARLRAYGWQAESDSLQQSHYRFATNAIAVTYVNALGRFSVTDRVCGFSMANVDLAGAPTAQVASTQAGLFASGNGVPPTSGVSLVYDDSVGGARQDFLGVSPTSGSADFSLDGALCLRSLVLGRQPTGQALPPALKAASDRVRQGLEEVRLKARLNGKPTLIVAGRNDALLPVNHTARAYVAANHQLEPQRSSTRYVEVTHAQHFDGFIAFGGLMGYDNRYVPLHVYFNQAMDALYAHLKHGTPLPPSQVVRTVPRGGAPFAAPAITAAHVPPFSAAPAAGDVITFNAGTLHIPD